MSLLSVVIPTRNRPKYLQTAIASVLDQDVEDLELIISDNSEAKFTERNESMLRDLVRRQSLKYLKPSQALSMVDHWNWALSQATGKYVTILTDRMCFKKGAVAVLMNVLATTGSRLLSYAHDDLEGTAPPLRYYQRPYSGQVIRVSGQKVINACRKGHFSRRLPRFLNSACRSDVLEDMRHNYGAVFTGLAPDYSFCFRAIDMLHEYDMLDQTLLISAGDDVSNGKNFLNGKNDDVRQDFIELGSRYGRGYGNDFSDKWIPWTEPVPYNIELLEYLAAREKQISGLFGPVDGQSFYNKAKSRLDNLREKGWETRRGEEVLEEFRKQRGYDTLGEPSRISTLKINKSRRRIKDFLKKRIRSIPKANKIQHKSEFASVEEVREYEVRYPQRSPSKRDFRRIERELYGDGAA